MLLTVLLGMLVTGCGLFVVSSDDDAGPEQFEFPVTPGEGPGARADQLLEGFGGGHEANHLVTVRSPVGDLHFLTFVGSDGNPCRAMVGSRFATTACTAAGQIEAPAAGELLVSGGGTGEWRILEITAGDGVVAVTATATDGTGYRAQVVRGVGAIVYPARRGDLTLQGLDSAGAPVGDPVTTTGMFGP